MPSAGSRSVGRGVSNRTIAYVLGPSTGSTRVQYILCSWSADHPKLPGVDRPGGFWLYVNIAETVDGSRRADQAVSLAKRWVQAMMCRFLCWNEAAIQV